MNEVGSLAEWGSREVDWIVESSRTRQIFGPLRRTDFLTGSCKKPKLAAFARKFSFLIQRSTNHAIAALLKGVAEAEDLSLGPCKLGDRLTLSSRIYCSGIHL